MATAMVTVRGVDELRGRLRAISLVSKPILDRWAMDAAKLMRSRVHSPTGRMRSSIRADASARYGAVYADWRITFQDKGTSAHGPKNARAMKFEGRDGPVFTKRVRGIKKRPFIRKSAREALKTNVMVQELILAWNGAGGKTGRYTLGDIQARKARARARRAAARGAA